MNKSQFHQPQAKISPEWMTFAIALAILSLVIALLVYTWKMDDPTPPVLSVSLDQPPRQEQQQFYVPFTVTNNGGETAESVQIIGELTIGNKTEEGEQIIDFLSKGEKHEGAFIFSQDPETGELVVRVASYRLP